MGVAFNMPRLKKLQERVESLKKAGLKDELSKRIGVAFQKQLADQFKKSVDPYGEPWAPVYRDRKKDRRRRARRAAKGLPVKADKPLVDTGRLRASATKSSQSGNGVVRMVIPVEYASYHQYGTKGGVGRRLLAAVGVGRRGGITRRQILPEANTGGLGPAWTKAANREAAKLFNETFKK